MYGYGYRYNSGLVINSGGGAPFANTKSLSFDGVDDGLSISEVVYSDAFTFSFWAKPTTLSLAFVCGDINSNGNFIWLFSATRVMLKINGVAYTFIESGGNDIVIGDWQNIVITRDSSNNINCYRNGVSFGTSSNLGGNFEFNSIGEVHRAIGNWHFNGGLDEFAVWDNDQSSNIATISTAPTVDLTSLNPIAWYRNGDNGAWKSPQWLIPNNENKDKVSNYSMDLDGVDDYLNIANNTTIGRTQNISYSIWVNLDVTSRQYIIGNTSSSNGGCGLQIESGDVLVFQMGDGGNDSFFNSRVANFSTYAPINTWNHILATWDGTDSKIYINGVLRNTWSPVLPYTIISYNAFTIGWRSAGFSFMTNGRLDELALFDSGISIGDVWDGSGQPIDVSAVSGITNYWKMGDNSTFLSNWTVPDEVGSNDGTSANMTIEDRIGEAPNSTSNAVSFNMDEVDRVTDVPT